MPASLHRLTAALLLAACGPGPADSDAGSSGATTSATDTSETPTTGEPDAPAVCDGLDEIPIFSQDTAQCVDFPGQPATGELEVGITNLRAEVIFVRGFGNAAPGYLGVTGGPFDLAVHAPYICGMDPPLCDDLVAGDPPGCLLNDKLAPPIRIEPGQRHHFVWEPLVVFPVEIPAECQPAPAMAATCTTSRVPTPGPYTLEISYAHADECTGECSCDPGPDGGCVLPDIAQISGPGTPVQARYDGACKVVDFLIQ